jgi:maltodextrin utilization protein YvdJ
MNTKQKIGNFFKTLINNTAAMEQARSTKWWAALILYLLSIIIAVIPTMIQTGNVKGQDIFRGNLYSTEVYLTKFHEDLATNNVDLTFTNNKETKAYLSNPSANVNLTFTETLTLTDDQGLEVNFPYYSFTKVIDDKETVLFRVFYTAEVDGLLTHGKNFLSADQFLGTYLYESNSDVETISTHLILGKNNLLLRIYNPANTAKGSSVVKNLSGVYTNVKDGTNLKDFYLKDKNGNPINPTEPTFTNNLLENWYVLANAAYAPIKTTVFFTQSGLSLLIYAVIGAFIGLIIFLSTRGKRNPNRGIRFHEAMKIGCWLLLTPALITLLIGSFIPQYAALIFVTTIGMRTVWFGMRTLNPYAQDQKK